MTDELKELGVGVGHRRVGSLLRKTDSDHRFHIAPSLLDRDFHPPELNQKWAGVISYIKIREGWLHFPQRQPILLVRLPEDPARIWPEGVDERQRQPL